MPIPAIDRQQAVDALRSTGSSDPDVLYARKEELLSRTRKMKLLAITQIGVGTLLSLTIVAAIIGVPLIIQGVTRVRCARASIESVETTYEEYVNAASGRKTFWN